VESWKAGQGGELGQGGPGGTACPASPPSVDSWRAGTRWRGGYKNNITQVRDNKLQVQKLVSTAIAVYKV
jgi:hypothetical protein